MIWYFGWPHVQRTNSCFLRHERETLEFDVANLHFSMCKLSDTGHALIYCLQIEAKEKQPL